MPPSCAPWSSLHIRPGIPDRWFKEDQPMKTFLLSLTAAAALAAAAQPAAAQTWRDHNGENPAAYGQGYDRGDHRQGVGVIDRLDRKITNAVEQRRISHREARSLRADLQDLRPIAWRVERGRADGGERRRLDRGVERIESALNRNDRYDRDDRRDYRR
jgi:hypothetical protein